MFSNRFNNRKLYFKDIGYQRFITGIVLGFCFTVTMSYFINLYRELTRVHTLYSDIFSCSKKELNFNNLFYACVSIGFGFFFTVHTWFWRLKISNTWLKRRIHFYLASLTIIAFSVFIFVSRFASMVSLLFYSYGSVTDFFSLFEDIGYIAFILPFAWFLAQLSIFNLMKNRRIWMYGLFMILVLLSWLVSMFTIVDRSVVDRAYEAKYKEFYDNIYHEIDAYKDYGINISGEAIELLKLNYDYKAQEQLVQVKKAFETEGFVSLDTMVMQKIMIMNGKTAFDVVHYLPYSMHTYDYWFYAFPTDIYTQIRKYRGCYPETQLLFKILFEEMKLVNKANEYEIDLQNQSLLEMQRYFSSKRYTNYVLEGCFDLYDVGVKLLKDENYRDYHYIILDEIRKMSAYRDYDFEGLEFE